MTRNEKALIGTLYQLGIENFKRNYSRLFVKFKKLGIIHRYQLAQKDKMV